MNKSDIHIGDLLYWNTNGAYNTKVSLKCKALDIGKRFIWIMVFGNLSPTPAELNDISKDPLYKVTNEDSKGWY